MAKLVKKTIDLKPILAKLGHSLEEIRVRSLDNILSKLSHGVLEEVDLVQEKSLLIRLLEWFNFSGCPRQKDVLELLMLLSKHASAAGNLVDIGGVEFLMQLRSNVNSQLHATIDSILDNLFHLATLQQGSPQECVYRPPPEAESDHKPPDPGAMTLESSVLSCPSSAHQMALNAEQSSAFTAHHAGYFNQTQTETPVVENTYQSPAVMAECFKFSTFPWVGLTATDSQVLASTNMSLRSDDLSLVASSCHFLMDVVFQDFPAEVFVQRPAIVQSLLNLVDLGVSRGGSISSQAMSALLCLSRSLLARIEYYQDPAFYTPKQEFVGMSYQTSSSRGSTDSRSLASSDTRPSVIGRGETRHHGDGQDGDNPSPLSSPPEAEYLAMAAEEALDVEDAAEVQAQQFRQWTVAQFCVQTLHRLSTALQISEEPVLRLSLHLLQQVAVLLKEAVSGERLWKDSSMPARELIESLHEILEQLSAAICFHHHGNLAISTPSSELKVHCVAFLGLGAFFSNLLLDIVPLDQCVAAIPDTVVGTVSLLCEDQSMFYAMPETRSSLMPYFRALDPTEHDNYCAVERIHESMAATCSFIAEAQDKANDNILLLVSQAEAALKSLPYHQNMELVTGIVTLASQISCKTSPNPMAEARVTEVLLKLLAHPMDSIRCHSYKACLNMIQNALHVGHVAMPASTVHKDAYFIINQRILFEIICFGMADDCNETQKDASSILNILMQSQLLLPASRWQQLLDALIPLLSLLQAFSSPDTSLGQILLEMLSTGKDDAPGNLPSLERLRGTLRLMFCHDARLRAEVAGKLTYFLAHEEHSLHKLPLFSELPLNHLTNLLLVPSLRQLEEAERSHSVFQEDGVRKVYDIFVSQSLDLDVKKSAADQLAIMVQDEHLQMLFADLGAADAVLQVLHQAVQKPEHGHNGYIALVPSLLTMLRHLLQHNSSLRHKIAHEKPVYLTVLRCALLHDEEDNAARHEAAMVMAFLVFDEMAAVTDGNTSAEPRQPSTAFCIPQFIIQRYRLPFRCPSHLSVSPHRVQPRPEYDPLAHGVLGERVRLSWQEAWCGGVEGLVHEAQQPLTKSAQGGKVFNPDLALRATDRHVIVTSHLPTGLQACVFDLQNATNHGMVTGALQRLASYLVLGQYHNIATILQGTKWMEALTRFLRVLPSSKSDEQLLGSILQLLTIALSAQSSPPEELFTWLNDALHDHQGPLFNLIGMATMTAEDQSDNTGSAQRDLYRDLQRFLQVVVGRMPYTLLTKPKYEHTLRGDLIQCLLKQLSVPDAAHFYNLASLEGTLLTLMHMTARCGWSSGTTEDCSLALCQQLLQGLMQVVSAFHIGRGATSVSYMGRGVTRNATLCLRHLAFEMSTQIHSQDWPHSWLYSRQATADFVGDSGLHWLTPLWTYRDTEVRATGLGIAVALASTEAGCITLTTHCQHITGGIWGAAFSVLLDHAECSIVREQAVLLLVNLTSRPLASGSVESAASVWQGPIVHNEQTQVSLVGLSALVALLQHSQFYPEMRNVLASYYPQPAIHPISVASPSQQSSATGSHCTTTTEDTGSFHGSTMHTSFSHSSAAQLTMTSTPASELPAHPRPRAVGEGNHDDPILAGHNIGDHMIPPAPASPGAAVRSASRTSSGCGAAVTEYASVATPCLLSGLCEFLRNLMILEPADSLPTLLHHGLIQELIRVVDGSLLESLIKDLKSSTKPSQSAVSLQSVIRLHRHVLQLLQLCYVQGAKRCEQLLVDTGFLTHVTSLLNVNYKGHADLSVLCSELWDAVFSFLTSLFQGGSPATLLAAMPALRRNWSIISGRCISILLAPGQRDSALWASLLQWLSVVLTGETMLQHLSSEPAGPSLRQWLDTEAGGSCSGARLCEALIQNYDAVALRPTEQSLAVKTLVYTAFKSLLASSSAARQSALKGGMLESWCEQLKQLCVQLSMEALDVTRMQATQNKEHPLVTEVILYLQLVQNAMYEQYEVKVAAYECNLSGILHQFWSWGQVEVRLLTAILQLLATYTAGCPKACSSLASTSLMPTLDRSQSKCQNSTGSLLHCLMRLVQREATPIAQLKLTFAVLANAACSSECCGVFWKSNFLSGFSSLNPQKSKKTRQQRVTENLWLDLLVNLCFSSDGQQMILKTTDSVTLLLELGTGGKEHHEQQVLLILRNMCVPTANKAKLLANEQMLSFLMQGVDSEHEGSQLLATSALQALVYNSQKAKVTVKSPMVVRKLQDTYNQLIHLLTLSERQQKSALNLHDVLSLLSS